MYITMYNKKYYNLYSMRIYVMKMGVTPVIPVTRKGNNANGCYIPLPPS